MRAARIALRGGDECRPNQFCFIGNLIVIASKDYDGGPSLEVADVDKFVDDNWEDDPDDDWEDDPF